MVQGREENGKRIITINPLVSYHLDGFETKDKTVRRDELAPVDYTNLKSGTYHFMMQVKDPIGHVDKTFSFQIIKEKTMSENTVGSIIMDASALLDDISYNYRDGQNILTIRKKL